MRECNIGINNKNWTTEMRLVQRHAVFLVKLFVTQTGAFLTLPAKVLRTPFGHLWKTRNFNKNIILRLEKEMRTTTLSHNMFQKHHQEKNKLPAFIFKYWNFLLRQSSIYPCTIEFKVEYVPSIVIFFHFHFLRS